MEIKEIKDAIDEASKNLKEGVEGAKNQAAEALKKAGEFVASLEEKADKEAVDTLIKGLEEKLKATQDHADALDLKLQKDGNKKNEQKSFSQRLYDTLTEKSAVLLGLKDAKKEGLAFDIKAAGTMLISGNYSGGTVGLSSWDSEFARVPKRQPFLREIVTVRPVSSSYVAWAEQANLDGGAGNTAEGAAKTQADFDIVEANKKVEKITSYIKVSKEALADIPYLNSEINTELVELLSVKLDTDILGGSGISPIMKGILEYAPAFSVAGTALALGVNGANNFDVIRAAVRQVNVAGKGKFVANYVVLHPDDAAMMDLTKATDGQYLIPPFVTAEGQKVAGLMVIENIGITAGDFLVGDFKKSNLGIREDINISIGYENDDFTKNLVTILGEVRAVHYIKSNHTTAFVKGTFATAKAAMETV